MSDKTLQEAAILKQHDIAPRGFFDEYDTGFLDGVRAAFADSADECEVCTNIRMELGGHPDSKLDGDTGLAAATMRELARLRGCITPEILKNALPGFLKIEEDASPGFWSEYTDNLQELLRDSADAQEEEG